MKKSVLVIMLVFAVSVNAQFKDQMNKNSDIRSGFIKDAPSSLFLGFFNPNNFHMNHSFNLSFSAFGGGSMALGVYTNSMSYKFSDNLDVQADISLVNSPYNSFGKDFTNQVNGLYLSRAQINYRPTDNTFITVQYNSMPYNYYSPYSYYGYSPFGYRDYNYSTPPEK